MPKSSKDVSVQDISVRNVSVQGGKQKAFAPARRPRARFSDDYEILLSQLIAARKVAGVTQKEIALRLGKDRTHVSKVEHRDRELNLVDMRLWCEALGLRMSDVVREWEEQLVNAKSIPSAKVKSATPASATPASAAKLPSVTKVASPTATRAAVSRPNAHKKGVRAQK